MQEWLFLCFLCPWIEDNLYICPETRKQTTMENKTELILIRISGVDRPGLTASVTAILSKYQVDIMDIGQADIHSTLSLGILFKCSDQDSGNIMKELLFKASDLGINIRFYPISDEEYETWVNLQGKNRYILTLLGRKLTAQQIAGATKLLAEQQLNIDGIRRLTGRIPLDEKKANVRACIEFSVRGTPKDREELQSQLMQLSASLGMDFSFQQDNMYRRMRRLICFDMDSTLIETEVIDELAIRAGVGDQVKAITERAMRGEIDFCESFKERVALLKGLDESVMRDIAEHLPITEGVERLMHHPRNGIYHICGSDCVSIAEIAYRVADVLGLDRSLIQPVTTEEMQEATPRPRFSGLDIAKAKREINYLPHTLEEGIKEMFS